MISWTLRNVQQRQQLASALVFLCNEQNCPNCSIDRELCKSCPNYSCSQILNLSLVLSSWAQALLTFMVWLLKIISHGGSKQKLICHMCHCSSLQHHLFFTPPYSYTYRWSFKYHHTFWPVNKIHPKNQCCAWVGDSTTSLAEFDDNLVSLASSLILNVLPSIPISENSKRAGHQGLFWGGWWGALLDVCSTSVGSLTRQSWAFLRQLHAHFKLLSCTNRDVQGRGCFTAFQRQLGQIWWDTPERNNFCSSKRWLLPSRKVGKTQATEFVHSLGGTPSRPYSIPKLICMTLHILAKDTQDIVLAECLLPCQGTSFGKEACYPSVCILPTSKMNTGWALGSGVVQNYVFHVAQSVIHYIWNHLLLYDSKLWKIKGVERNLSKSIPPS